MKPIQIKPFVLNNKLTFAILGYQEKTCKKNIGHVKEIRWWCLHQILERIFHKVSLWHEFLDSNKGKAV